MSEKSTSKADFHGAKSNPHSRTSSTTREAFGDKSFSSLNIIQEIKDSISKVFLYDKMTKCQELAIPPSLEGNDVLVKAKTGTGKTLGFLIPAINRLQTTTTGRDRRGVTSILIISPTRELASQIHKEAKQLLTFLPHLSLQCCLVVPILRKTLTPFAV